MSYTQNIKDLNELANSVYMHNHVGTVSSFPEFITVMPLVKCNYDCIMCAETERKTDKELSEAALGGITPPFGCNIFTAVAVFRRPYLETVRSVPVFIIMTMFMSLMLIHFPEISLFLTRFGG